MNEPAPADVFVVFGITGDLAKVMTFSLAVPARGTRPARLPDRGASTGPSTSWSSGPASPSKARGEELDSAVFDRFAARLSYVQGDFGDAATYDRVGKAIEGASTPVFYLEIPPFLFGTSSRSSPAPA